MTAPRAKSAAAPRKAKAPSTTRKAKAKSAAPSKAKSSTTRKSTAKSATPAKAKSSTTRKATAKPRHAKTSTAPRHASRATAPRLAGTSVLRRVVAGDRPYVVAFFVMVAVLAMMVVGPLHSYTAAAERVADLEASRTDLQERVAELEDRQRRLNDPEEIELVARRTLGYVKPGEIPYVVTDGKPESDQVRPDGRLPEPAARPSALARIGQAFLSLFRR